MDTQKQVIDRLKQANNVLVTVSNNPSVDQLAACIGLSLALNKLDKHATAVFSGKVPSTIEFLEPGETIEKNTDSLRDFIISLDKSKADKLRYKVEDKVVRIFITPYRTSISDEDLEFGQGDFNVDVVLAIGVHEQRDLDQAVTAHGRILHDATVITVNNQESGGELGSIHWTDTATSSLSEMAAQLVTSLSKDALDQQISTAFLTGIVAETNRFSNDKTSAETMNVSAALMSAGANQQLVATKLQEGPTQVAIDETDNVDDTPAPQPDGQIKEDGTLEINHNNDEKPSEPAPEEESLEQQPASEGTVGGEAPSEEAGQEISPATPEPPRAPNEQSRRYKNPRTAISPPPFSSDTDPNLANMQEEYVDPLTLPPVDADHPVIADEVPHLLPDAPSSSPHDRSSDTLQQIEKEVNSPHLQAPELPKLDDAPSWVPPKPPSNTPEELNLDDLKRPEGIDEPAASVDAARDAVAAAMSDTQKPLEPISALNAQPLGGSLHAPAESVPPAPVTENSLPQFTPLPVPSVAQPNEPGLSALPTADQPMTMPLPGVPPQPPKDNFGQQPSPNAAPAVPPPIVPPFPQ